MGKKQLAALGALACVATSSVAFDGLNQSSPGVMFYYSMPLDGSTVKQRVPAFGVAIKGSRPYEAVYLDSRMINNFTGGVIEAKWIIAGVVAAGAAAAVANRDKKTNSDYSAQQQQQQEQQQQQQQNGGDSCSPTPPTCP